MNVHKTPRLVAWLAYGGLVPFIALTAANLMDKHRSGVAQHMLLTYGAVILSFVGALHWGFAMTAPAMSERKRNVCFAWSVVPALLAWIAQSIDPVAGSALLAAGFAVHFLQDWRLVRHAGLPAWYLPMRFRLTVVAALSLLVTSFALNAPQAHAQNRAPEQSGRVQ